MKTLTYPGVGYDVFVELYFNALASQRFGKGIGNGLFFRRRESNLA
jgi:hypothetical protein